MYYNYSFIKEFRQHLGMWKKIIPYFTAFILRNEIKISVRNKNKEHFCKKVSRDFKKMCVITAV